MPMDDVTERFVDVMNSQDNYQSVSLPLASNSEEVIFFYYASSIPGGFVFEELGKAAFRDLETSIITVKSPSDLFSPEELEALSGREERNGLIGLEALEYVKTYYDLHEQLLRQGVKDADEDLLQRYLEVFSRIVPAGNLRRIYYRVGGSAFQSIALRIGSQLDPKSS